MITDYFKGNQIKTKKLNLKKNEKNSNRKLNGKKKTKTNYIITFWRRE